MIADADPCRGGRTTYSDCCRRRARAKSNAAARRLQTTADWSGCLCRHRCSRDLPAKPVRCSTAKQLHKHHPRQQDCITLYRLHTQQLKHTRIFADHPSLFFVFLNKLTISTGSEDGLELLAMSDSPGSSRKRVALVTGSASGIGADIAIKLAAESYIVIVTGRNEESMQRVVAECNKVAKRAFLDDSMRDVDCKTGLSATSFKADLLDLKQVDKLIEFVRVEFGCLDVLVNNACWRGEFKQPLDCDRAYDDFRNVMHINVSVPVYLIHRCLIPLAIANAKLKPRSHCASEVQPPIVINISSIAGQVVVPLHSYSVSKACLSELTRQLTVPEVHDLTGLLAVTISPGPILTDELPHHREMSNLTLLNRVGTTKEVANLVMFAITNARIFHGRELTIDGGYVSKQKNPNITASQSTCCSDKTKLD